MKSLFLAAALLSLALPVGAMEEVHLLSLENGQTYKVTELVSEKREQISPWNALRFKRGTLYRTYKLLDTDYPLVLAKKDFKKHKQELKGVIDKRPWDDKHSDIAHTREAIKSWAAFADLTLRVTGVRK